MSCSSTQLPLKTENSLKDRLYWNFFNLIPFLIGSIAIARDSLRWAAIYIGIAIFFLLIIQFRFIRTCSMYYSWNKGNVKCMLLPRIPEIFKDGLGLHSTFEKLMMVLGAFSVFLFPIYWLIRDPLLLGAYIVAWILFFSTLRRYECTGNINFGCPIEGVSGGRENDFQKKDCGKGFEKNLETNLELCFEKKLEKSFEKNSKEKNNHFVSPDHSGAEFWISGKESSVFLKMKHEFKDFLYWNFVTLPLLLSAGFAVGIHSTGWLIAYIFVVIFHFNILEQRFFCTHCPYYSRGGKKFRCMMNWGWPKHFSPRPSPPGKFDLAITTLGFIIVIFFPIPWLLKEPFLLGAYSVSIVVFLLTIWKYECSHCIYFGCPFNRVKAEVRKEFEESR